MHLDIRCKPDLVSYLAYAFQGKFRFLFSLFQKLKAFLVYLAKLRNGIKTLVNDFLCRFTNDNRRGSAPPQFAQALTHCLSGYTQFSCNFGLGIALVKKL